MGKIDKGVKCSVILCGKDAIRSVSLEKVKSAQLKIEDGKRTYLCEEHYKAFKKKNKNTRQIEKWRWSP
ncbi:MAG: hypothetical protein V1915_03045 [Candidatus Bathyarchaeota archaeon]